MGTGTFNCPVDGAKLQPMERQGIEIDFCPDCRGVWLDRGELDKMIERSGESTAPAPAPAPRPEPYRQPDPYYGGDHRGHSYGHGKPHYPQKRRKSFLEELFD